MDFSKENMKRIAQLIVFTVFLIAGLFHMDMVIVGLEFILGILSPFLIGASIAFVLNLPMRFIEARLFPNSNKNRLVRILKRPVSLVLSILLVVGIVALVLLVVVPELVSTMAVLMENVEAFVPRAQHYLEVLFHNNRQALEWVEEHPLNWDSIVGYFTSFLQNGVSNVLSGTISTVLSMISGVVNFFIGLVFSCYVLMQKERLGRQLQHLLQALLSARRYRDVMYILDLCNKTFSSFIAGQCLDASILGLMFVITMTVFGLPYPLLMGVLIGFTALIPVFGAFIGCVVGVLLILMVSPIQALVFLILFLVLQQLEENFVYPHVVGSSVGLPSIWVLVAVVIGGSLMGVIGMLIFIPLSSVFYTLLRRWTYARIKEKREKAARDKDNNSSPS